MKILMITFFLGFIFVSCSKQPKEEFDSLKILKKNCFQGVQEFAEVFLGVKKQFKGVTSYGERLSLITETEGQIDVDEITVRNPDYWRATLEMAGSNPTVLFSHAYLLGMNGKLKLSEIYIFLGTLGMAEKFETMRDSYDSWVNAVAKDEKVLVDQGIVFHDKKEYKKAIQVYEELLERHPNSSWGYYELGFSTQKLSENLDKKEQKKYQKLKDAFLKKSRALNPFFLLAYQTSDKKTLKVAKVFLEKIKPLFSGKGEIKIADLRNFAIGCEEMGLHGIAAHTFWKLVAFDADYQDSHIRSFLRNIEKAGCKNVDFFYDEFGVKKEENKK